MSKDEFDDLLDNEDAEIIRNINTFQSDHKLLESLPTSLRDSLLPFQREGVLFGIKKKGCCLLGDEMGLGKTIQAIAIASYYETEWPMLVVVPSSMKYVWLEELQRWLSHITPDTIHLVRCAEDVPNLMRSKISIVSYGLFQYKRFFDLLENLKITFKVIVCDESHYLKNWKSVRTKHLVRLLHNAKRRILLTGTPALARPEELYTQINSIAPRQFGTYTQYCATYCQGHYNYRLKKMDYSGASNLPQLHDLLTKHVMIRRLKAKVLTQLPAKQRQKISFDLPASAMKDIEKTKLKIEELKLSEQNCSLEFEINKSMMELYKLTGLAKIPASVEYVKELLKQNNKFLVFAHHIAMLDAIEKELMSSKTDYIRIDGSVPSVQRQDFVKKFQNTASCKVALLGIQAGGVGLTLTAASIVVFCELHWSPGILQQAEDRVHRISQKNAVNIYYLIGLGTMDETLWKKLNRKMDVVGKALEGHGGDMATHESSDKDMKELLAACTSSTVFTSPRKRKKVTGPEKPPGHSSVTRITLTPGQTKLTSFLNMSIDEDFKDQPCGSSNTSYQTSVSSSTVLSQSAVSSQKVEKLLEKAEVRRDKLRVSLFNKQSKDTRVKSSKPVDSKCKRKLQTKESPKSNDNGKANCSKYFSDSLKTKPAIVTIDSSSDEELVSPQAKRSCSNSKYKSIEVSSDTESLDDTDFTPSDVQSKYGDESAKGIGETTIEPVSTKLSNTPFSPTDTCSSSEPVLPEDHPDHESKPSSSQLSVEILSSQSNNSPNHTAHSFKTATNYKQSIVSVPVEDEQPIVSVPVEDDSVSSDVDLFGATQEYQLKFSVSAYTERIYLYDYSDTYLETNVLISDISDDVNIPKFLSDNSDYLDQVREFVGHWENISKSTKSKLYNKVISSVEDELKYIYDNRIMSDIRHSNTKPDLKNNAGATKKRKIVKRGKVRKEVEVDQHFTSEGDPVCMSCGNVVLPGLSTTQTSRKLDRKSNKELGKLPFQGMFCSLECFQNHGVKANSMFVRKILFDLELGICQICNVDTNRIFRQIKLTELDDRINVLNGTIFKKLSDCQKRKLINNPTEGLLWQADHVIPVSEGGGECDIDNYRTLCTVCHKGETRKLLSRLSVQRDVAKNNKLGVVDIRTFLG